MINGKFHTAVYFMAVVIFTAVCLAAAGCGKPAPGKKAHILKIGMQDEPKQLNPFKASDVWSWNVIGFLYETLYTRNPETLEIIPWLAEGDPEYDKSNDTCIVRLKKGVIWEDGTPFTAKDVAFTGRIMIDFKIPRYYSDWEFVENIEALDDYTVKYTLKEPYAIFFTGTLMSLIVPEHVWKPVVMEAKKSDEPLVKLLEHEVESPVGFGAFTFKEWKKGSYAWLVRNPRYFAAGMVVKGREVGPYIDEIIFKIYGTTDAAILALKKGDIDFIWWPLQTGFIDDLRKDPEIGVAENHETGVKYVAFNLRKEPFDDLSFRRAAAYLVDKDFLVKRVLQGYGIRNDSVVPPGNELWLNKDTAKFGKGMSRAERMREAVRILKEAGYTWGKEPGITSEGKISAGKDLITPDGKKVRPFSLLTPPADYDPQRAMAGTFIQEWWREAGIPVSAAPTSFGDIINKVHTERSFDSYLLGWVGLSLEADYMRVFFHSSGIVRDGYNSPGYSNPEYDVLAERSAREMDENKRRELILEMQDIVVHEVAYIPLFTVIRIEGYRQDRFEGWVNQLGGIGNGWSFVFLKPVEEK